MSQTVVNTGSSSYSGSSAQIVIPTISSSPVTPTGMFLLSEFGLTVKSPAIVAPDTFNWVQILGSVETQSNFFAPSQIRLVVTQTNTLLLGAPEDIIYVGEETVAPIDAVPYNRLISFSTSVGGINNSIPAGYYRYRLYIGNTSATVVPGQEPIVTGPFGLQATSFLKSPENIDLPNSVANGAVALQTVDPSGAVLNLIPFASIPGDIIIDQNTITFTNPGVYALSLSANIFNVDPNPQPQTGLLFTFNTLTGSAIIVPPQFPAVILPQMFNPGTLYLIVTVTSPNTTINAQVNTNPGQFIQIGGTFLVEREL